MYLRQLRRWLESRLPYLSAVSQPETEEHFWNLTRNIFRFIPARECCRQAVRTVEEGIEMNTLLEGIRVSTISCGTSKRTVVKLAMDNVEI